MSKLLLKKELQKLTKEQLIEQIIELYDTCKQVKEYYKVFLNPEGIQKLLDTYKDIIDRKFNPSNISRNMRTCFPIAKKAIADFSALKPPPKMLADLLVTLAENACDLSSEYGDMPEQHYNNTANCFVNVFKIIKKEKLLDEFRPRCMKCLKNATECGGGFSDEMNDVFDEYYNE
jgi:hypothetical protein